MNVREVLSDVNNLNGTVQTIEGVLMENNRCPFIGDSTRDWASGCCIHLQSDKLFDLLLETLFPNIIGGGDSLFLYPSVIVGRIELDNVNGICSISDLHSITIDIHGEQYCLNFL